MLTGKLNGVDTVDNIQQLADAVYCHIIQGWNDLSAVAGCHAAERLIDSSNTYHKRLVSVYTLGNGVVFHRHYAEGINGIDAFRTGNNDYLPGESVYRIHKAAYILAEKIFLQLELFTELLFQNGTDRAGTAIKGSQLLYKLLGSIDFGVKQ